MEEMTDNSFGEKVDVVENPIHRMVSHHAQIDVVKFDGKNNFGMWRYEVQDALCSLNLEDALDEVGKPNGMRVMGKDEPKCVWIDSELPYSRYQIFYHDRVLRGEDVEHTGKEVYDKECVKLSTHEETALLAPNEMGDLSK